MKLPEYVEKCWRCEGKGEYKQSYTAGCGGGMFNMLGPCSFCSHPEASFGKGLGYRMKDPHKEVSSSVINQIKVMNEKLF